MMGRKMCKRRWNLECKCDEMVGSEYCDVYRVVGVRSNQMHEGEKKKTLKRDEREDERHSLISKGKACKAS